MRPKKFQRNKLKRIRGGIAKMNIFVRKKINTRDPPSETLRHVAPDEKFIFSNNQQVQKWKTVDACKYGSHTHKHIQHREDVCWILKKVYCMHIHRQLNKFIRLCRHFYIFLMSCIFYELKNISKFSFRSIYSLLLLRKIISFSS